MLAANLPLPSLSGSSVQSGGMPYSADCPTALIWCGYSCALRANWPIASMPPQAGAAPSLCAPMWCPSAMRQPPTRKAYCRWVGC